MKLSIILPTFNDRETIRDAVTGIQTAPLDGLDREVIVVDDASTDGTREVLSDLDGRRGLRVLHQSRHEGRGPAIARGFAAAGGDVCVLGDTGLSYDLGGYATLVGPILAGKADVVFGSRFLGSPAGHRVLGFRESIASRFVTLLSNALTGLNLTDIAASCKAMTRQVAGRLDLQSSGSGVEPEIACKVSRLGVRVYEVPMPHLGPAVASGGIGAADALRMMGAVARYAGWDGPEHDVGVRTLRRMARLGAYNRWLHAAFEAYLGERVLEVGAGVGNQTQYFVHRERVIAADIEADYVNELQAKFGHRPGVRVASFSFPLGADEVADLQRERLDTVVCLNVLEHIEDDRATLEDFARILRPGGHLVLIVPSMPSLYGTLDVHLHHFRRYERETLRQLLVETGFEPETVRYMNRLAVPGWWLNSRVLKRKVLPRGQLGLFRLMMPLLKFEERHPPSFGLSLLALARRR
jgi:2-polyprenyl-3-methyl-5-hydroxy-6-metoxy-1,4-benzoquinol methylase